MIETSLRENTALPDPMAGRAGLVDSLTALDERLRWLWAWVIHNANHLLGSRNRLKVGGHQASRTSISTIMGAPWRSPR